MQKNMGDTMSATFWLRRRAVLRAATPAQDPFSAPSGWRLPRGFAVCELCNADVPLLRLLRNPRARRCRRCESSA
jgi:hypothetical protein